MDLHTALICLVVFVVSAVVVYLISVLGIREKTFEEAIAEQRRKDEEVLVQKKSDKTSKDKKHKKWGRKSKEKSEKGGDEGELHVGFKPEAEIIPDEETVAVVSASAPPLAPPSKGSKKGDEPRSILINKKDKALVPGADREEATKGKEPEATDSVREDLTGEKAKEDHGGLAAIELDRVGAAEELADVLPEVEPPSKELLAKKDGLAKHQLIDKKEKVSGVTNKGSDQAKEKRRDSNDGGAVQKRGSSLDETESDFKKSRDKESKAEVRKEEAATSHSLSPGKKSKKSKVEEEVLSGGRLMALMKASVLSDTEITSLIEVLLDKRQLEAADAEWLKIGQKLDPMSSLRKQLQEAEGALSEERQRAQAAGSKLKDLRQELNGEKTKSAQLDRARQQELQNVQAQLHRTASELSASQSKNQQLQAKLAEELTGFQQLKDEVLQLRQMESKNACLQHDFSKLEHQLEMLQRENGQLQNENDQLKGTLAQLEHQCQQFDEQVQATEMAKNNDDTVYQATINELRGQLEAYEGEKAHLTQELQRALANLDSLTNDLKTSHLDQDDLRKTISSLGGANEHLANVGEELKQHKANLENQLLSLQAQLQEVGEQLAKSDQELAAARVDNEFLASQVSRVSEREEAEGQEGSWDPLSTGEKTNGHIQLEPESGTLTKIPLSEHEHILHEKEKLVAQLTFDLKDRQALAETLTAELAKTEELNGRLREDLRGKEELLKDLPALREKEQEHRRIAAELQERERDYHRIAAELSDKELEVQRIATELSNKEQEVQRIAVELRDRDQRMSAVLEGREQDSDRVASELRDKDEELRRVSAVLQEKEREYDCAAAAMKDKELEHQRISAELQAKTLEVDDLVAELTDCRGAIDGLKSECERQRDKNNERILEVQRSERKAAQDVLKRIFPTVQVEESLDYSEWVSTFEARTASFLEAASSRTQPSETDATLEAVKQQLSAAHEAHHVLQAQVERYERSLVETEDILQKLQRSVEEEEDKWKERLKAKEQQIEKMLKEKSSYDASMEQLKATEEELVEMQEKLAELQVRLESEETERRSLEEQRRTAEGEVDRLRLELQQAAEVEAVRVELERERLLLRDLADQVTEKDVRLRTLQDTLEAERSQTKVLQQKMEALQLKEQVSVATNGPPQTEDSQNLINEVVSAKN